MLDRGIVQSWKYFPRREIIHGWELICGRSKDRGVIPKRTGKAGGRGVDWEIWFTG